VKDKITKHLLLYPKGYEPDYLIPSEYSKYRFAIGKLGADPLVAICMNPSAARDESSDRTINRIIHVSQQLAMDGWVVFNTYPERATDAKSIGRYDDKISKQNIDVIRDFLIKNDILKVWGAWGDDRNCVPLISGKRQLLEMLNGIGVEVYYYGTLTNSGNPRHPLQRTEKMILTTENKHYL